jgi:hypothetical protein
MSKWLMGGDRTPTAKCNWITSVIYSQKAVKTQKTLFFEPKSKPKTLKKKC